jgi:hypothetical protein
LGGFDFAEIIAKGKKNKRIDENYSEFFAKSICDNRNRLAFVVYEILFKKWWWVAKILMFFFGFCADVFSATAALKNSLVVFK